jgi:hypothetical protein
MIQLPLFSSQAQRTLAPQVCGQPALRTNNPLPPPSADVYFSGKGQISPVTLETRRVIYELRETLIANGTFEDYLLNPLEIKAQHPGINIREARRYAEKIGFTKVVSGKEVQKQAKANRWLNPESHKRHSEDLAKRWADPEFRQRVAKVGPNPFLDTVNTRKVMDELKNALIANGTFEDYLLNPLDLKTQYPGINIREIRRYAPKIGLTKMVSGKEVRKQSLASRWKETPEFLRKKQSEG